jgi:hypothetical protein
MNPSYSNLACIILREGLMPEDQRSLTHIVIVSKRLTVLRDTVLHTVLEVLRLGVAVRFQHALQEDLLVLLACRLVLLT